MRISNALARGCIIAISICMTWIACSSSVSATPMIALKESQNCAGCHKPGRSELPVLERRCTLDCVGCHIDPAGGGARNAWGNYYQNDQLSPINFIKPIDPLQDKSYADIHLDSRIISRQVSDSTRTYPMSNELTLRVRPLVEYLHFTYSALLFGRVGDKSVRALRSDHRRFREKYSLMVDQLPLGSYARWYRGAPMYGIRRPNHTLWIRERIGLDQFAMTEAIEVGGTPTVPFIRGSQMTGDPYQLPEDRQKGTSFHGGLRGVTAGWHLNSSYWSTESTKKKVDMTAFGAGLSPWDFLIYGERNWRAVQDKEIQNYSALESLADHTQPSSVISEYTAAFAGIPGVIFGYVHEELQDSNTDSMRRNIFVDFHPLPGIQFEIWRRFESGSRRLADNVGIFHLYGDF